MLKTFTILATVPASYTASSVERAMLDGLQAFGVEEDAARVDAFEGDHFQPMDDPRANVLAIARRGHEYMRNPPKPRTWADLSADEQATILRHAEEYGGGFVSHLCSAWKRADGGNSAKLGEAFGAMLLEGYCHALESKV